MNVDPCIVSQLGPKFNVNSEPAYQRALRDWSTSGNVERMAKLTEKQRRFCYEFVKDLNGAAAARRAGFSPNGARQRAAQLFTNSDICELVERLHRARLSRAEVSAESILQELARCALASPQGLVDASGRMLAVQDMSPEVAAAVAQFDLVEDDQGISRLKRVRMVDKVSALNVLCKHLGLLAPERHLHAVVGLTPEELTRCSDDQLQRIEDATQVLSLVQQELGAGARGVNDGPTRALAGGGSKVVAAAAAPPADPAPCA